MYRLCILFQKHFRKDLDLACSAHSRGAGGCCNAATMSKQAIMSAMLCYAHVIIMSKDER
jgi:hypothetical protein